MTTETNPHFYFMHFFIFIRSALNKCRQQGQFPLLCAVPQLSCVYLMSHFLLVTCLCHLQNSHTGVQWLGGDFELFFPLAESFEITGRKFYKPVLLLLWITEKRFHLSDVDNITVAVCLQKASFCCAEKSQSLQELLRMTHWMSSTLLWSLINLEDFVCAWLCGGKQLFLFHLC